MYALAEMQQTQPTKQMPGIGVEISTEDIKKVLADKTEPVVDVRSPREYSIAHIPGSVNIYETEIDKMAQLLPDKKAGLIIYCNGPFCHKVKRVAEKLIKKGYPDIKRYQLGLPVWRAYGNTVQTDMEGFKYIFSGDKTAVFVDARDKQEFTGGTVPGAVNVRAGKPIRPIPMDAFLTRIREPGSSCLQKMWRKPGKSPKKLPIRLSGTAATSGAPLSN
jgi:rhodanese-related sulfurtransferase